MPASAGTAVSVETPGHDLVRRRRPRERRDFLAAAPEDEWVAAFQPHDPPAAPAVVDEELVHLLLRETVARDPRRTDGLHHELERDEPVVDEDLATRARARARAR